MGDALDRLPYLLYVALPLLFFMAWVYLGLHILFARFVSDPQSPVLWFFGVVTGPLTRPVRAVLAAETPEPRVRLIAFASYVGLWLVARVLLAQLMGSPARQPVLALAAANVLGVALFGTLYVVAGLRYMSQAAFLGCLALLFGVVTMLWLRVEAHHRPLQPARRVGRVAASLMAVVIAVPIAVLTPLFWLDAQLPVEAGLNSRRGAVMVVVLIALVLTLLVNVVGGLVLAIRFAFARSRA